METRPRPTVPPSTIPVIWETVRETPDAVSRDSAAADSEGEAVGEDNVVVEEIDFEGVEVAKVDVNLALEAIGVGFEVTLVEDLVEFPALSVDFGGAGGAAAVACG